MFGPAGSLALACMLCVINSKTILNVRQEKISSDAVQKIKIIENTLTDIEGLIENKDEMIRKLNSEVFKLKAEIGDRNKDIATKMKELSACRNDQEQMFKHRDFIKKQETEILRLKSVISNLENKLDSVREARTLAAQEDAAVLSECEAGRNRLLRVRDEYQSYKVQVFTNMSVIRDKNAMLETAMLQLRRIVQSNDKKVQGFKERINELEADISEKNLVLEDQAENLTLSEAGRKSLVTLLRNWAIILFTIILITVLFSFMILFSCKISF